MRGFYISLSCRWNFRPILCPVELLNLDLSTVQFLLIVCLTIFREVREMADEVYFISQSVLVKPYVDVC